MRQVPTGRNEGKRLRVLVCGLGGVIPDEQEITEAVLSRLGEGEDGQDACLFDLADLPGDDD